MRILITGSKIDSGLAASYARAFRQLDCEVEIFPDGDLYENKLNVFKNRYIRGLAHRLFWKFLCQPINKKFLEKIEEYNPDLIFVLKGWYLMPKTFQIIKQQWPSKKIFIFNPDNPFNTWHHGNSNSWIVKSIPLCDAYFIWGKFLINKILKSRARKVEYLPFGYDKSLHYLVKTDDREKKTFGSDIAFVGTWDKEREWWLNYLLDYDLKIWGNSWEKANKNLQKKWQKKSVIGEDFSKVCNAAKININIIRKQNGSAHNMRTFEISACGGFVLSTMTNEVKDFFEERKEAEYFSSPEELKQKIDFYLKNDDKRLMISMAGYNKLINSNYNYESRAKTILNVYKELKIGN